MPAKRAIPANPIVGATGVISRPYNNKN